MYELSGIFVIGVASSLSVCTLSCLGYLAPVLITDGFSFRSGVQESFLFMSGKILLYAVLGGFVAWSGSRIPSLALEYTTPVSGGFLILLGLWLHFRKGGSANQCLHSGNIPRNMSGADNENSPNKSRRGALLFLTGLFTSLIPCPAVMAMLTLASRADSVALGFSYGLSYGVGLLVSPVLIAGGGLSMMAQKIRLQASEVTWLIRTIASAVIIISGIRMTSLSF